MDTPGNIGRDYYDWRIFANEAVRTFTQENPSSIAPSCSPSDMYLNIIACNGMKIDVSSISLTYS